MDRTAAQKELDALSAGYQKAFQDYLEALRALARSTEYREAVLDRDGKKITALRQTLKRPQPAWVRKFQDAAEKYQGDDRAMFLIWLPTTFGDNKPVARRALATLLLHHMDSERLATVIKGHGVLQGTASRQRAREVYGLIIKKSPHKLVQAYAYHYRALLLQGNNASDEDKRAAEADIKKVCELVPDSILALTAAAPRFDRERLQVGMKAPDIVGEDIDGVTFSLRDYLGKVVILDFWRDW